MSNKESIVSDTHVKISSSSDEVKNHVAVEFSEVSTQEEYEKLLSSQPITEEFLNVIPTLVQRGIEWIDAIYHDVSFGLTLQLIELYEKQYGTKPWGMMCESKYMDRLWCLFETEADKIDECGWDCLSGCGAKYLTVEFVYKYAHKLNLHELYGHSEYERKPTINPALFCLAYYRAGFRLSIDGKKIVIPTSSWMEMKNGCESVIRILQRFCKHLPKNPTLLDYLGLMY